jgi:hypothetical protein
MSYTRSWNEHAGSQNPLPDSVSLQKRYTLYSKVLTFHSSCKLYIEIDFRRVRARKGGRGRILRRCLPRTYPPRSNCLGFPPTPIHGSGSGTEYSVNPERVDKGNIHIKQSFYFYFFRKSSRSSLFSSLFPPIIQDILHCTSTSIFQYAAAERGTESKMEKGFVDPLKISTGILFRVQ